MIKIENLQTIKGDAYEYYNSSGTELKLFNKVFLADNVLEEIKDPRKYFIVGEKGSGKTAYSVYFSKQSVDNIEAKIKFVQDTVYDKFIRMKKNKSLDMSSYKDVWMNVIYLVLSEEIKQFLPSTLLKSGPIKKLDSVISEFYSDAFSPEFIQAIEFVENSNSSINAMINGGIFKPSVKFGVESSEKYAESNYQLTLIKLLDGFKKVFKEIQLDKQFILFIDGIDARPSDIKHEDYIECLRGLVNAVIELNNSELKDKGIKVSLLIRPDIIYSMSIHNMNQKLRDNSVLINWNTTYKAYRNSKLFEIADNYFLKQQTLSNRVKGLTWDDYFPYKVSGREDYNSEDSFIEFLRYSLYKPRDILTMLNELVEKNEGDKFSREDFANMIKTEYPQYLLGELKDYMLIYMDDDEYNIFQKFIKSFRTKRFTYKQFEKNYKDFVKRQKEYGEQIPRKMRTPEDTLQLLYDTNIIGYREHEQGRVFWSFKERSYSNVRPEVNLFASTFAFHYAYATAFKIGS
ncbi:hypothetical protein MK385_08060 [Streptococcus oralis]|uniref:P-loop ATPase, Sll1717 family n=1 Tax=Streptococcus oralis TaxID=1303 RepID=UPI0022839994|nr:hypothetical protein [Streptococcus oralis]MCY7062734.1 hypothetical protein [Streptococcus oralis]